MILTELATQLHDAVSPEDVFGTDAEASYRELVKVCHPDRNPGNIAFATEIFQLLEYWHTQANKPPIILKSPLREYALGKQLATGDLSDVFLARSSSTAYVVKLAKNSSVKSYFDHEKAVLDKWPAHITGNFYAEYLPHPVDNFVVRIKGRGKCLVLVFSYCAGYISLEEIRKRKPLGVDARTAAWMFNRILEILGQVHSEGILHGAVLPCHLLYHPKTHGLILIDWTNSVKAGHHISSISSRYKSWYPAEVLAKSSAGPYTDLFMAAKCALYAAGYDDPNDKRTKDKLPREYERFLDSCIFERPSTRPQDARELRKEHGDFLERLFGKPQYHPFVW